MRSVDDGRKAASSSPSEGSHRYGREHRLSKTHEFRRAYRAGRKLHAASATLFLLDNDLGRTRLGVTVTRRIGNAVARNRLKRKIREIFRRNRSRMPASCDIVVNVRSQANDKPYREMEEELLAALAGARPRRKP